MASTSSYASTVASTGWSSPSNIIGSNVDTFAVLSSGYSGNGELWCSGFSFGSSLLRPQYSVDSIMVTLTVAGVTTPSAPSLLKCALSYSGTALNTLEQYVPVLSTDPTEVVLTFTSDVSGYPLSRYSVYDSDFSVLIKPHTSYGNSLQVATCKVTVNYSTDGYLFGNTSKFPKAVDSVAAVVNSPTPSELNTAYVIKSETMNLLSDAIIKVQKTLALDQDTLRSLGPGILYLGATVDDISTRKDIYAFTMQITGNSLPTYSGKIYWQENSTTTIKSYEQSGKGTNERITLLPGTTSGDVNLARLSFGDGVQAKYLMSTFCKGSGWVVSGGVYYPLNVTPKLLMVLDWQKSSSTRIRAYSFGWSILPVDPSAGYTWTTTTSNRLLPYASINTGAIYGGSNSFEIRLTGLLQELSPNEI